MTLALAELRWAKEYGAVGVFKRAIECVGKKVSDPYFYPLYEEAMHLDLIEAIEAADSRTIVARWKSLFIEADTLFSPSLVMPLPRPLLAPSYLDDRAYLTQPYWRNEFVTVHGA